MLSERFRTRQSERAPAPAPPGLDLALGPGQRGRDPGVPGEPPPSPPVHAEPCEGGSRSSSPDRRADRERLEKKTPPRGLTRGR